MTILTVGIDLAKNVFAVHGINEAGKAELIRPAVPRDKLHELVARLQPRGRQVGRLLQASGHTVRLIAPKFVTPYRMTGKRSNYEAGDAAAICKAALKTLPVVLALVMAVEVIAPPEALGDVSGDLLRRRGQGQGQDARGPAVVVTAHVPLADVRLHRLTARPQLGPRAVHDAAEPLRRGTGAGGYGGMT